ncbi:MAG: C-GCAxxG-C-C family protein [Phycisphaerae bacterium]
MASRIEQAVSYFEGGFNCAQSVIAAYGPPLGLDEQNALRIATGFGGGIGQLGWTCGVVTGATMVISLLFGRTRVEDRQIYEQAKQHVRDFVGKFIERNGDSSCSGLIGVDVCDPDARARASRQGIFRSKCPGFVRDAAEILEEMFPQLTA